MSLKLWLTEINKIYLWSTEINKAYLWNTLVYDNTATPNWLLNNLVSYYKCDTSWSFPDAHWSNDWTINGATYTASGKINWAYDFDWVNDNVNFWNTILSASALSISMWINLGADTWWQQWLMSQESGTLASTNSFYFRWLRLTSTTWYWNFGYRTTSWTFSEAGNTTPITIPTSQWVHLVAIQDTPWWELKLYVNWVQSWSTTAISLNRANSATNLRIWQRAWWNWSYVNWQLDEIWIWNWVLTSDQVTALYNSWAWLSYDNFTT